MQIGYLEIYNNLGKESKKALKRFLQKHKIYTSAITVDYCLSNEANFLRAVSDICHITDIVGNIMGEEIQYKYSFSFGENIGDFIMRIVVTAYD